MADNALSLREGILARRSVRAFRPDPVPRDKLMAVLALATRSPSGTNLQPWRVHVCSGAAKAELTRRILAEKAAGGRGRTEFDIYPRIWHEPYQGRRRELGKALYQRLGIPRDDLAAREAHFARNYDFFGAPLGLFFTVERGMGEASWIDTGMFMQTLMLAACAEGLATCAQQAFLPWQHLVCEVLRIPPGEILLSGMALGYADPQHPANDLLTARSPPADFVRFCD